MDTNDEPLIRNFRTVQPLEKRRLFHVSPSGSKYSTLLPVPQDQFKFDVGAKYPKPLANESGQINTQEVYRAEIKTRSPFKQAQRNKTLLGFKRE